MTPRAPEWWEILDLDWEVERLFLDLAPEGHCGSCGAGLYTDGTCPNCDRTR